MIKNGHFVTNKLKIARISNNIKQEFVNLIFKKFTKNYHYQEGNYYA